MLGQQHTGPTVDQALYCKLVELKWAIPEYQKKLVVLLGGLHISMCFQKVIGNHMKGSGLVEAWVKSGLLGLNATEHVMNGKAYKRAMCAHKITLQSLWQLLIPFLLEFCQKSYPDLYQEISALACSPENAARKSSHARALLDVQISTAVARRQNCFVPVFEGANRTMLIYIPVKTLTLNELSDVFHCRT